MKNRWSDCASALTANGSDLQRNIFGGASPLSVIIHKQAMGDPARVTGAKFRAASAEVAVVGAVAKRQAYVFVGGAFVAGKALLVESDE